MSTLKVWSVLCSSAGLFQCGVTDIDPAADNLAVGVLKWIVKISRVMAKLVFPFYHRKSVRTIFI